MRHPVSYLTKNVTAPEAFSQGSPLLCLGPVPRIPLNDAENIVGVMKMTLTSGLHIRAIREGAKPFTR